MLALSNVLEKLNQPKESENWYRKAIYVFRRVNKDRLCKEFAVPSVSGIDIEKRINQYIFDSSRLPPDLQDAQPPLCKNSSALITTHDPRSLYAQFFTDAPGRVWLNPLVKQRGIVCAIHGLSLEHSSHDALAKELADEG